MKKILLSFVLGLSTMALFAQIPVSTSPENKNVVLEEFTGIHCGYCPQGHAIAKAIQDANPNDVVLINIHVGSYAAPSAGEPDFRTPFGTAIVGQTGIQGYPAGTINRHSFGHGQTSDGVNNGVNTAESRGSWTGDANTIKGQASYVNVGIEASVNVVTRELSIHVQAYYTAASPVSTNKLNVVLLQNNILGPQSGGGMGNEYVHMHMLRHMITGQWGETLDTTTSAKMINRWYTYTIPADYISVPVDISNLEVAAFITQTQQEVISGSRCFPTYTGIVNTLDAGILSTTIPAKVCGTQVAPIIKIRNMGANTMTSATISYSVNGGTASTYNWTGTLTSYQSANVTLPGLTYTPQASNTVNINVISVNGATDQNTADNTSTGTFAKAPQGVNATFTFELKPDNYGSETTWKLKNSSGTVLYQGGPYTDNNTTLITQTWTLPSLGCYTLEMYDAYGDGINAGFGVGYYKLKNSDGTVLIDGNNFTSASEINPFEVTALSSVSDDENAGINIITVYPNPTTDFVNIINAENSTIQIYDVFGKLVAADKVINNNYSLNVSEFAKGTYVLKITNGEQSISKKITVL